MCIQVNLITYTLILIYLIVVGMAFNNIDVSCTHVYV